MDKQELESILEASRKYSDSNGKEGSIANLCEANLRGANLHGANLHGANLHGANLYRANLSGVNLLEANLSGASFYEADLHEANLRGANLYGANLRGANLRGANLCEANLSEIRISNTIGERGRIRSAQISFYSITYTCTQLAIGCTQHSIEEWKNPNFLTEEDLVLWDKHSNFIWTILERYPADT